MAYKAVKGAIVHPDGTQVAIVVPVNCSKKMVQQIAAYAAQQMNHAERDRLRRLQKEGELL